MKMPFEYQSKELDDRDAVHEGKSHTGACAQVPAITVATFVP
jgi:hypothetical protein